MVEYVFINFVIKFKKMNPEWFKNTNVLEKVLKPIKKVSFATTLNNFYDDFKHPNIDINGGLDNLLNIKEEGVYSIADNKTEPNNEIRFFIDNDMLNIDLLVSLKMDELQSHLKELVELIDGLHSEVQNDANIYTRYTTIDIRSKVLKYPIPPKDTLGHLIGLCFNKNDEAFHRNYPNGYRLIKNAKVPSCFQVVERDYGLMLDFVPDVNDSAEIFKNITKAELWLCNVLECKIDEDFNELGDKKMIQKGQHYKVDYVGRDDDAKYHYYFILELDENGNCSEDRWSDIIEVTKNKVIQEYSHINFSYVNIVVHKRENVPLLIEKTKEIDIHKIYYVEDEKILTEEYEYKELWDINPSGNWLSKEEQYKLLEELKR